MQQIKMVLKCNQNLQKTNGKSEVVFNSWPKKDILIPQSFETWYKIYEWTNAISEKKKIFLKDCYFYCRKKATKRDRLIT